MDPKRLERAAWDYKQLEYTGSPATHFKAGACWYEAELEREKARGRNAQPEKNRSEVQPPTFDL